MKIIIQQGRVVDPSCQLDTITDIAIENGKIAHVGIIPPDFKADKTIEATNRWVVPGLVDLCCRPQMRHPQGTTLYQEAKAAISSGVTSICIPPDGDPIVDNTANVIRLKQQNVQHLPHIYPIGALTKGLKGKAMSDLSALAEAGCIAFSQAQASIKNLKMTRHCYDYAASFNLPVIIQPNDPFLSKDGVAHEGKISSRLGLPGIPDIAETIAIAQHLLLIEKTGIRAHFTCLSTQKGVAQIKEAQAQGLPVSADTAMHSLHLTEDNLSDFDSDCHLYPPLRTQFDKEGLMMGVKDSVLSICSDHRPLDSIAKLAPFGESIPGLSSLDTLIALGVALVQDKKLTLLELIRALSTQPAKWLQLPAGSLMVGACADICIIDPEEKWTVTEQALFSKGKNTPFKGTSVMGKVTTTLLSGEIVYVANAS